MASQIRWIWGEPGCGIAQISAKRLGPAMEVEVYVGVHGDCPLPMGMEKQIRRE